MLTTKPIFRNPEVVQELLFRTWIRENCPTPTDGLVVEDLDLLIRWFGEKFHQDEKGRFMFVEIKYRNGIFTGGQRHTWGLIDWLLCKADPNHERYRGFFLVRHTEQDWNNPCGKFFLNNFLVPLGALKAFLEGEDIGCPSFFNEGRIVNWHGPIVIHTPLNLRT